MPKSLPARPSLEQLKNQAKDLLKSHQSREPEAIRRIHENHPRWEKHSTSEISAARLALSDAQWVIAREYGFSSWTKLKEHVDSVQQDVGEPMELLKRAMAEQDAGLLRRLFERHPEIKQKINEPVGPFDSLLINNVRNREMLDLVLAAGADINAKSRWWAGGFGILELAEPTLAAYAIERGAVVDVHAAARLGLLDRLREIIAANPELVNARGGDGQTPLHFASTVEIAQFLLDHGANLETRDLDHESTPAQYMVRDRQPVLRYLIERGCQTDFLMAAALGDETLVRKYLAADPDCIRMNVSERYFPKTNPHSGGTIYIWTLGANKTAQLIAREFGHEAVFRLLMERTPDELKFALACEMGDEALAKTLLAKQSNLVQTALEEDQQRLARAAQSNNTQAVRLMLSAGWPVDARGQHGGTALHWAAFHGNAEMVAIILRHHPSLELPDLQFKGPPLGWAIHGSVNGWHCRTGDYVGTVKALLDAGAKRPEKFGGTEEVRKILQGYKPTLQS